MRQQRGGTRYQADHRRQEEQMGSQVAKGARNRGIITSVFMTVKIRGRRSISMACEHLRRIGAESGD